MKFFLLLVAATCGIATGLPATNIVGGAISTVGSGVAKGITSGTNATSTVIGWGNSTFNGATRLVNSTVTGGLGLVLKGIQFGTDMANKSVLAGGNMTSSAVKGVGNSLKGIWGVGRPIEAVTNWTASAISSGANMASSGVGALQTFENKKFNLMNQAVNVSTNAMKNIANSGMNMAASGVNSAGSMASSLVTSGSNTTASWVNKLFSLFG